MEKFEALYQGMYDDLKDSEMMIKYAHKIVKNPENKGIADEIAKYAQWRLEHFKVFHTLFQQEVAKEETTKEKVSDCLWGQTHKYMMEWHAHIKEKIDKY